MSNKKKICPAKKALDLMASLVKSTEYLRIPILLSLFPKLKEEGTFPDSFYAANIILIPKPDKDTTRKLQTNISYEHWCKNPQQNNSKQNSAAYWKNSMSWPNGIYSWNAI